jgi:TatD DNase family protein
MRLFDTHAHIGLITEDPIEQLLVVQEAKQEDVVGIVSISNNLRDFEQIYQNLRSENHVYHSIGVSPSEVSHPGDDWEARIQEGSKRERIVAVGEIGLDYYHKFGDRDSQIELFIRQLDLAQKLNLPVIIHNREAGSDVLEILKERIPEREDYAYAKRALELNLYISFAGNVTYRNARNLHETARQMPLDRILIESEAPFMVPAAYRGKRNKPSFLKETSAFVAELREMPEEELSEVLFANSLSVFGLQM